MASSLEPFSGAVAVIGGRAGASRKKGKQDRKGVAEGLERNMEHVEELDLPLQLQHIATEYVII